MEKRLTKDILRSAFILLILASFPRTGNAQSVWIQDYENEWRTGIEFIIPSYSFTADQRGVDFASYLYTNVPLSQKWSLQLVFPISRYNGGGSRLSSGNPFIGFQYINSNGLKLNFGAHLPLIQDNDQPLTIPNTYNPYTPHRPTSVYDVGAFSEIKTAVSFNLHYRWGADNSQWIYKVGQGLAAIAPMGGGVAVVFKYYGHILYEINNFTLGGGLEGHILTNRDHYLYPDRNAFRLGLFSSYDFGRAEVGTYAKNAPIFGPSFVFGLNIGISL